MAITIILISFMLIMVLITILVCSKCAKDCGRLEKEVSFYKSANQKNNVVIETITKSLENETRQSELYRLRTLELEDSIKESVGVSLRNEITKVDCFFNENEMSAMLEGLRFMIKEYYKSTSGVKYYITLIEKIEKNLSLMMKSIDDKNKIPQ